MNKILVRNVLLVVIALVIGFYIGTPWDSTGTDGLHRKHPLQSINHVDSLTASPYTESLFSQAKLEAKEKTSNTNSSKPVTNGIEQNGLVKVKPDSDQEPVALGFDSKKLEDTYQQIYSEDTEQRRQALQVLAQLGSEEIIPELIRIAADDNENSEIRRDLIQQIQWSGHTGELSNIITQSRDAEARLAAVNAVMSGKITETELTDMSTAMLENLHMEAEDGIKIATLNYFLSVDPIAFQQIVEQHSYELSSPEVQNYLNMITTPPSQTTESPQQTRGIGG